MVQLLFIDLAIVILWFFGYYRFRLTFIRISVTELNVVMGFCLLFLYHAF